MPELTFRQRIADCRASSFFGDLNHLGEGAGTTQRKVFKIIRTDAGGFFGLTEWEGLPMEQFQGRYVGLLSPKPLTAEVIEVARVMLAMKGLNEQKLRGAPRRR